MKVLVAVASKHGSTTEIGEAIADELKAMGLEATVREVAEAPNPDEFDAIVLGSAIYMGRLMGEARRFAATNALTLSLKPLWLFASGPIGDPPQPAGTIPDLERLATEFKAREARTFAGRLDPAELGFGERLITKAVHAQAGDFRAWGEILAWARVIGSGLTAGPVAA